MPDLPDWYAAAVLKGLYGTELKTIAVDELGRLYAVLRAIYGVTPKDVQCDTNGNLTLNLKAQDLAEVINRPKYGAAQRVFDSVSLVSGGWRTLFTISGKGIIYGGYLKASGVNSDVSDEFRLIVDGNWVIWSTWNELFFYLGIITYGQPMYLSLFDSTNHIFTLGFSQGITFETSISIQYYPKIGTTDVYYQFCFALI